MTQVPIYDPQAVEARWQARWVADHTNEPDLDRPRQPFYNLMMFPYPSAEGLHVGNMFAFTGADIYGRVKRLQGHDVFEPIGFDAFGIHSENYALQVGTNPAKLIPKNIETLDRKSTRLNSSHGYISYAVFCLKKKNVTTTRTLISNSSRKAVPVTHSPGTAQSNTT